MKYLLFIALFTSCASMLAPNVQKAPIAPQKTPLEKMNESTFNCVSQLADKFLSNGVRTVDVTELTDSCVYIYKDERPCDK